MRKPKTPRPPSDRGQGRKPLKEGVETVQVNIRLLPEQREKLRKLGDGDWLRRQIDAAPNKIAAAPAKQPPKKRSVESETESPARRKAPSTKRKLST